MANQPPVRATICVATYKRPVGLARLIDSIGAQDVPDHVLLDIVVVDNDPEAPLGAAPSSRFPIRYVLEAERGIVPARNRALEETASDADFIIFVDDDERVRDGWIRALLACQAATGAQAVQGPVRPVFETPPPDWMRRCGMFEMGPYEDGAPIDFAATNNVLVDKRWIDARGLRLDPQFGRSGGSDHEFFTRLQLAGGRIVTARDAIVDDDIPATRIRFGWLLRRQYRKGNTLARIALRHRLSRAMRLAKGMARIGYGLTFALGGLALGRHPAPALCEAAFGAGIVMAFMGMTYFEYKDSALLADRASQARATGV